MSGKRIIVYSLGDARAALAAARSLKAPITLASAAGAGGYAGPLWFKSLIATARADFPDIEVSTVLDCGAEAGTTLGALRHGFKRVRFTGNEQALGPLRQIAQELGAEIETGDAPEALDLLDAADPEAAARAYIAA